MSIVVFLFGCALFMSTLSEGLPFCAYRIYTLTERGKNSKTDNPISIKFHIDGSTSPWHNLDSDVNDRERQHWDRYIVPNSGNGHLTGVTVRNLKTDGWEIEAIYVKNLCTNRVYEFYCTGSCWVDSPAATTKFLPRSNTI
ncbi:unnamed protein product [Owenia fusiformis]|uniref:Uncharacterized protein n=1 Tax=Owenia fusiformis TaxID=6347 RepID=A0A8J1UWJ4_OWEFU|nr:unnamed protein product [Owenia fusiformis]